MSPVKGWVSVNQVTKKNDYHEYGCQVEEIPANAIRGEELISGYHGICDEHGRLDILGLPEELIGKQVSYILIPQDREKPKEIIRDKDVVGNDFIPVDGFDVEVGIIHLPAELIGKKISYVITVEED